MKYLSVKEIAKKWGLSERTVRNYCAKGKIEGAYKVGRNWCIPDDAIKRSKTKQNDSKLLETLRTEKESHLHGGIYHRIQIDLTYNSNHIEGSQLTHEQTRYIFETNTLGLDQSVVKIDDIIETVNHFRCIDFIIDEANNELTESFIKKLHEILKTGTLNSRKDWFRVGEYKLLPNEVGGHETVSPEHVEKEIIKLLTEYNSRNHISFDDLLEFHVRFENIHPFQDGNGRVGRLIMFKECLKHNIVPFIIDDNLKMYYYRGISEWDNEKGYLRDTCLTAQDSMKRVLEYFRIPYNKAEI